MASPRSLGDAENTGIERTSIEDTWIPPPLDVTKPIWNQNTFTGRLNYFFRVTNPLLLFKSRDEYNRAKKLVLQAQ